MNIPAVLTFIVISRNNDITRLVKSGCDVSVAASR